MEQTSKNDFFDQLFQIFGPDTQNKSCSATYELTENGVDRDPIIYLCRDKNKMAKSKIFKKSPTSRGHRNFFRGQNQKIPTLNKSWMFILKNDLLTTGGPLGVN